MHNKNQNRVTLFANALAFILSWVGLYGAAKVQFKAVLTHAILTAAGFGAFFVFQLLEIFLKRGVRTSNDENTL